MKNQFLQIKNYEFIIKYKYGNKKNGCDLQPFLYLIL